MATLESLTSGLVAVFRKFNRLQHATCYDETIAARSPLFKALHLTNPRHRLGAFIPKIP